MNLAYESATFWIHSPRWKFLNTLWIRNRVDAKSGYFISCDVTRSSPVLYREYCIQDGSIVPRFSLLPVFTTHALLPIFPEELMGTRVNPDTSGRANSIWIGIREDVEIFELEKKKLRTQNIRMRVLERYTSSYINARFNGRQKHIICFGW